MSNSVKYSLFVMFVILCCICGFIGGAGYFEDLHSAEIARTGTETTAIVDDGVTYTDGESTEYYYILFHYYDEAGGYHEGETNTAYTYDEAYKIVMVDEQMQIKYNDKFEAVAADFKYSHNFGFMMALFYIGVVGGALTLVYGVIITLQAQKLRNIKKNGKLATATFVEKTCNSYVNGSPRYRIVYKFVASEEGGEERTVKSKDLYKLEDAVYYETNKQFDVRYSGKLSVIAEKPYSKPARTDDIKSQVNTLNKNKSGACEEHNNCDFDAKTVDSTSSEVVYQDFDNKELLQGNDDNNILCEHCAAHLSPNDKHCPNCGAKVRKK